jgi:hypothetical protein
MNFAFLGVVGVSEAAILDSKLFKLWEVITIWSLQPTLLHKIIIDKVKVVLKMMLIVL